MKLAFSTLGCPGWSWGDILATAKDLGFQGIELRGVQHETHMPGIRELRPAHIEKTREQLLNMGLSIPCITGGCKLNDPDQAEAIVEYLHTAAALQAPYVRVLGDDTVGPEKPVDLDALVKNAKALAPEAIKRNVTILIETNGAFAKSALLKELLDRIGSPAFAALWDVHHTYRFFHEPPADTLRTLGGYVKHVHCKDSVMEDGNVRYRIMGQGDVPLRNAVVCLQDAGYDGYYCLEWVKRWDLTLEEPGIAFAQYLKYMRG